MFLDAYKALLHLPPEAAHQAAFFLGKKMQKSESFLQSLYHELSHESFGNGCRIAGMNFLNPIGLAAGFDKDAELLPLLSRIGFSFLELGTVTPLAQIGNPKPRLFRLKKAASLVNRMGFNNCGLAQFQKNLLEGKKHLREGVLLGVNLGKNKAQTAESAHLDYALGYQTLVHDADYFTLNVSSPNTPGLRDLQSIDFLGRAITAMRVGTDVQKPIFVKLSPDLSVTHLQELCEAAEQLGFAGIILTNTSNSSQNRDVVRLGAGGLSGALLRLSARENLIYARQKTTLPIISVGGIDSADEVRWRLDHGANLTQIYTAMIYKGPRWVSELARETKGFFQ